MPDWKLTAEDRLEIQELYARYAWGIDLADIDLAIGTFTEDAWFDHLWQGRVQGHEAIRKNLESLWNDRQHWWYGRQHMMNHFIMDEQEEEGQAKVRCFFQILQYNVDYNTNFVFGIGTRQDLCVKQNGRWFFQSLHVNAWTAMDQIPWKGELRMKAKPSTPPAATDQQR